MYSCPHLQTWGFLELRNRPGKAICVEVGAANTSPRKIQTAIDDFRLVLDHRMVPHRILDNFRLVLTGTVKAMHAWCAIFCNPLVIISVLQLIFTVVYVDTWQMTERILWTPTAVWHSHVTRFFASRPLAQQGLHHKQHDSATLPSVATFTVYPYFTLKSRSNQDPEPFSWPNVKQVFDSLGSLQIAADFCRRKRHDRAG